MKGKVVAVVLFVVVAVSSSLAQEDKEKALSQTICNLYEADSPASDAKSAGDACGEAVASKDAVDQAHWKTLNILYKGVSLAPLPHASVPLPPDLGSAAETGTTSKPQAAPQALERRPVGFYWDAAIRQSVLFLGVQHSLRLMQAKTVEELRGPFFADYLESIKGIKGWEDGDGLITNYLGHPAMGAIGGYIQIQNDPKGHRLELSRSKAYWQSRLKALAWSTAYSTQFEIGLVSEATLGNVGKRPNSGGFVDFVITPTLGTLVIILEDAVDKYVVNRLEKRTQNFHLVRLTRTFLNPMRTLANLLRFKKPWYRDRAVSFSPGEEGK
jgi:hypothetical protein